MDHLCLDRLNTIMRTRIAGPFAAGSYYAGKCWYAWRVNSKRIVVRFAYTEHSIYGRQKVFLHCVAQGDRWLVTRVTCSRGAAAGMRRDHAGLVGSVIQHVSAVGLGDVLIDS